MLAINSHQPWEGPVTWYEAHVHSEEGWNMTAACFRARPSCSTGTTRISAGRHTNNYPDLVDVYELDTNPDNPNQYRYDGAWRELEVREAPITGKAAGATALGHLKKKCYGQSTAGHPQTARGLRRALCRDGRTSARSSSGTAMNGRGTCPSGEDALRMATLPMFKLHLRGSRGETSVPLPGAASPARRGLRLVEAPARRHLEDPVDRGTCRTAPAARVKNPASGFVQNCNNTPFAPRSTPKIRARRTIRNRME